MSEAGRNAGDASSFGDAIDQLAFADGKNIFKLVGGGGGGGGSAQ